MTDRMENREQWLQHLEKHGAGLTQDQVATHFEAEVDHPPLLSPLLHLSCLSIQGEDAEAFLDGQVSAAVQPLEAGRWILTAWHDPKGRARTLLHLTRHADGFLALMPRSLLSDVLPKLKMYILRSQVTIEAQDEQFAILGYHGPEDQRPSGFEPLSGAEEWAFLAAPIAQMADQLDTLTLPSEAWVGHTIWRRREIVAGIPAIAPATSGRFLPQFLDLERFGGLSFKKGCYIGQEVIARTHYLGKVKQGLARFRAEEPPESGANVRDSQGRRLGQVLDGVADQNGGWLVQVVIRDPASAPELYMEREENVPLQTLDL